MSESEFSLDRSRNPVKEFFPAVFVEAGEGRARVVYRLKAAEFFIPGESAVAEGGGQLILVTAEVGYGGTRRGSLVSCQRLHDRLLTLFGWMHGLWHSRRAGLPHVKPPPFAGFVTTATCAPPAPAARPGGGSRRRHESAWWDIPGTWGR
jgi:hypothetical protein